MTKPTQIRCLRRTYNMVSANKNAASAAQFVSDPIRNKDGSIRQKAGRKIRKARASTMKQRVSPTLNADLNVVDSINDEDQDGQEEMLDETCVSTDQRANKITIESEGLTNLRRRVGQYEQTLTRQAQIEKEMRAKVEQLGAQQALADDDNQAKETFMQKLMEEVETLKQQLAKTNPSKAKETFANDAIISSNHSGSAKASFDEDLSVLPDIGGYKMKISRFLGKEDEDYDVWWEDLQAFLQLYNLTEKAKFRLFNAHLGGEARKFIQNEDLSKISRVEQLHQILRGTFSDKYDWHNVLMNISQKQDEKLDHFPCVYV